MFSKRSIIFIFILFISNSCSANPRATRTGDFIDTIGVNTHISYIDQAWGNWNNIQSELVYLGIHRVRDGIPYDNYTMPFYKQLASIGIKFNILPSITTINFSNDLNQVTKLLSTNPKSVTSFEGPNEYNTNNYSLNGQSSYNNIPWGALANSALHYTVKGNSSTANLNVIASSVASIGGAQLAPLGDQSSVVDASNWHIYFNGGTQPYGNIVQGIQWARLMASTKPVFITETGYYTAVDAPTGGVSENVQARLILNLIMDAVKYGSSETYIYSLMDNILNPPSTDVEDNFGLFHGDGTPKLAATGIHNLTTILYDPASTARTFNSSWVAGLNVALPANSHSFLMQKSNGNFFLLIWAEPQIWNNAKRSEIVAAPAQATVTFSNPANISLYDPLSGISPTGTYTATNSINAAVIDHPIVIEISP